MLVSRRFHLVRSKMLDFLDEIARQEGQASSLYLSQGTEPDRIKNLLPKFVTPDIPTGLAEGIASSKTGAVLFWGARKCLVIPPFPIRDEYLTSGCDVGPLRSLLKRDFLIAIVLIRMGAYSLGVCRGTELIESKTGTGLVHARHRQGGSSAARFARHREKQIEYFLERVCGHLREHLEPHARLLDYIVYGGARTTILSLRKRCQFLQQFDDRVLRMLLDIPEPRRPVLEKAIQDIWSSSVIEWHEENV